MNLGRLFSVNDTGVYKVIYLLGLKLKINKIKLSRREKDKLRPAGNKVVFSCFMGRGYGCNPKYIAQEIIRRKLPYDLVWLVDGVAKFKGEFPEQIRPVEYYSKQAMRELMSAKVWVDNNRKTAFWRHGLRKQAGQSYIQTWHGSLGIKKIDADVPLWQTESYRVWVRDAQYDSQMTDYLLLNSAFEDEILPHALWYSNKTVKSGHPRNDVFFADAAAYRTKIGEKYHLPQEAKILLYAPSFRDDHRQDCFTLDYQKVLAACKAKFGGKWVVLVRMHPRMVKYQEQLIPRQADIVNVTDYPDVQELLAAADMMITDYSSCVFDYMLSRKPAFLYAPDVNDYDTERGFYYPLTATPFAVAENNEQLCGNILNFNLPFYQNSVEEFLRTKGCMEDGHAAKRVVDLIETLMKAN